MWRLTEEEINILPHYIEWFCHRLVKDMLVNFLLFISTPMLTQLCLWGVLLNLISMMDCESFKKRLADEFSVCFCCCYTTHVRFHGVSSKIGRPETCWQLI